MDRVRSGAEGIATRCTAELAPSSNAVVPSIASGELAPTLAVERKPGSSVPQRSRGASPPRAKEASLGGQNAAFATAMKARERGEDSVAVQLLDDFIAHYPGAPLAQDAHVERFRALLQAGEVAAASRGARRYLALYPNGFARDEARDLVLKQ